MKGTSIIIYNQPRQQEKNMEGGSGLAIHTPLTSLHQHLFSSHSPNLQVYSRKKKFQKKLHLGCSTEGPISATNPKLKTTIHSPNHHQLGVEDKAGLDQVGISSNIDKSPIQIDYEEEEGATKQKQEAAALWEMAKELGVTCGPQQNNYVSKLMEMEKRDKIEAQSVGSRRGLGKWVIDN